MRVLQVLRDRAVISARFQQWGWVTIEQPSIYFGSDESKWGDFLYWP